MKFSRKFCDFVNGNVKLFVIIGIIAIVFTIIGHYEQMGFNWKWFIFFELPLYIFCGWALHAAYKLYKLAENLKK